MSITKILLTVAVAFAAWYAFRWFKRLAEREESRPAPRRRPAAGADRQAAAKPMGPVEDLIACPACGDYGPAGAAPCARADCPRR